jgi:hypothetical protein
MTTEEEEMALSCFQATSTKLFDYSNDQEENYQEKRE